MPKRRRTVSASKAKRKALKGKAVSASQAKRKAMRVRTGAALTNAEREAITSRRAANKAANKADLLGRKKALKATGRKKAKRKSGAAVTKKETSRYKKQ